MERRALIGTPRTAIPARSELAFQRFTALCAVPRCAGTCCCSAVQEFAYQLIRVFEHIFVFEPNGADVRRQFADAAGEKLAAHDGGDPMRLEITSYQMRFGRMARVVQSLHGLILNCLQRLRQ
jgi:hypothetical protein